MKNTVKTSSLPMPAQPTTSFHRRAGIVCAVAAMMLLTQSAMAQSTMFTDPGTEGHDFFNGLLKAMNYFFYALYVITPFTIYQAWQKYKEGDQKGMGQYILGTIGIFCSPTIPYILRAIAGAAGGFKA